MIRRDRPAAPDEQRRRTARDSLGVGLAVGLYGAAFGAASIAAGLDVLQTSAMSLLMFTGASQFAMIGVLGAGGAPLAAVASALLLGTRNSLYGLRLAAPLGLRGRRRVLAAHLVIDETTAMALAAPRPELMRLAFTVTGVSLFVGWNLATLAGALGSELLGGGAQAALDAVVPAAFLALLWPRLREGAAHIRVAAGGAVATLALTPVVAPGLQVMLAAAAVVLGLVPPARREAHR